jgi:hypothetical protein
LQLRRAFPLYGLVLLGLVVVASLWLLHRAVVHDEILAPYIAGGTLLMVLGLHQRRGDHHFLQRHVPGSRVAMAIEYGALTVPVAFALLLSGAWRFAGLLFCVYAIPWVPVVRSSGVRGRVLRRWIPAPLFEWRALVQGSYPWPVLLWLSAMVFCWLPVLPLFLVGVIAMLVAGAQEQCEPRAMLLATASDGRTFLRIKVLGSLRIMLILIVPVLIGATLFRPEWWWIHGLIGAGMLVLMAYAIVLKYANYRPDIRLEANGANVAVAALFAILPGLSLVPLIMLLTEWPKAHANLNAYFHDHDH